MLAVSVASRRTKACVFCLFALLSLLAFSTVEAAPEYPDSHLYAPSVSGFGGWLDFLSEYIYAARDFVSPPTIQETDSYDSPDQEQRTTASSGRLYERSPSEAGPYEASPYEANPYEASPYEASPYEASPYEASPYEDSPYGDSPYGDSPYGDSPDGFSRSGLRGPQDSSGVMSIERQERWEEDTGDLPDRRRRLEAEFEDVQIGNILPEWPGFGPFTGNYSESFFHSFIEDFYSSIDQYSTSAILNGFQNYSKFLAYHPSSNGTYQMYLGGKWGIADAYDKFFAMDQITLGLPTWEIKVQMGPVVLVEGEQDCIGCSGPKAKFVQAFMFYEGLVGFSLASHVSGDPITGAEFPQDVKDFFEDYAVFIDETSSSTNSTWDVADFFSDSSERHIIINDPNTPQAYYVYQRGLEQIDNPLVKPSDIRDDWTSIGANSVWPAFTAVSVEFVTYKHPISVVKVCFSDGLGHTSEDIHFAVLDNTNAGLRFKQDFVMSRCLRSV